MKFIKTHGKYFLWFIGAAVLIYVYFDRDKYADLYTAEMIKNKILSRANAEEKVRADYYAEENSKLLAEREKINMDIDLITADSRRYQAEAKTALDRIKLMERCEDARAALIVEFNLCQNKVKQITDDYVLQIDNLTLSYNKNLSLKNVEISELISEKTEITQKYAEMVAKNVLKSRQNRRGRAVWFLVGIVGGVLVDRVL